MKIYKILLFSVLAIVICGCSKAFLDKQPAGGSYTQRQLAEMGKKDPLILKSTLTGSYILMTQVESGGRVGSHIDFGQKSLDIISDILVGDMNVPKSAYGQYSGVQDYSATSNTMNLIHYQFWRYYYKFVFNANPIIESLGGREAKIDKTTEQGRSAAALLGQALSLRAYAYFYLLQFFSSEYAPEAESVCLYTSSSEQNMPLSKQKDVYDFIVKDLTAAIDLLQGYDRLKHKEEINQNVARGLLAYTYAAMGNWEKVKEITNAIINSKEFTFGEPQDVVYNKAINPNIETDKAGFNNVQSPNWMWGIDIEPSFKLQLVSFWGMMDIFTFSYASVGDMLVMSDVLYNSMKPDDVRRLQFETFNGIEYAPYNKFYNKNRKIQGQREIESDYVYMRVEEMYLLNIEAEYNLGKYDAARAYLKGFLSHRLQNVGYIDDLSIEDLKTEINNQWRLEFWGEGKAYLALKRFKTDIQTGSNRIDVVNRNVTIKWNDAKLIMKVPDNERVNNPNVPLTPANS